MNSVINLTSRNFILESNRTFFSGNPSVNVSTNVEISIKDTNTVIKTKVVKKRYLIHEKFKI